MRSLIDSEEECIICGGWRPIEHVFTYRGKEFTETLHLDRGGRRVREVCAIGGDYVDVMLGSGFDRIMSARREYWKNHNYFQEI